MQIQLSLSLETAGVHVGPRAKFHPSQEDPRVAWNRFRAMLRAYPEEVESRATQAALLAGARKTASGIKVAYKAAGIQVDRERKPPGLLAQVRAGRKGRGAPTDPTRVLPLYQNIKAKKGRIEYFPSALVLLRTKGRGKKAARTAHLVDKGHLGPNQSPERTPAHPFILPGITQSEAARNLAVLKVYQKQFPDLVERIRRIKASAGSTIN